MRPNKAQPRRAECDRVGCAQGAGRELRLCAAIVMGLALPAYGQWVEQTFELDAGWNSIFLEVDPAPRRANELFAGQPISAVWLRVGEAAPTPPKLDPACNEANPPADCPRPDASCIGPNPASDCPQNPDTRWRVWLPPGAPAAAVVTNLRLIDGGRVYNIQATKPTTLTITGRPSGFTDRWRAEFNPVGFYVNPDAPPTFEAYLAPASALSADTVYTLQPDGTMAAIQTSTPITPGTGYWVLSAENLTYTGPLSIDTSTLSGIAFGKRQLTHPITLENLASTPRNVTATYLPSAQVPKTAGSLSTDAGEVPLHRLDYGEGSQIENILQWHPLDTYAFPVPIPPDGPETPPTTLEVGVRRAGLSEATLDVNFEGSEYQGILQVSDDGGFRRLIGVTVETLPVAGSAQSREDGAILPRPGLYLGFVTVDHVSWVTAGARVWENDDANEPQFAGLLRCVGGINADQTCFPDRNRCGGTAAIELNNIVCDLDDDCPVDGICETVTDCPDGNCAGFCIGGSSPNAACGSSADCAGDDGVCSADLDVESLRPTPFEFKFPVIIHLSDNDNHNQYKLLTEVSLLKTDNKCSDVTGGPCSSDGDCPADVSCGYDLVLGTPDCGELCGTLQGALTVNGEPFARRVSTAAFSFADDLEFDGGGGFSTSLAASTTLAANDPLNPFMHTFHPDHDCVDPDGDPSLGECMAITRTMVFAFDQHPPEGQSVLDWGDSVLGGVFTDQVSGLHRESIAAQGRFRLRRVSSIGALNTPWHERGAR